MRKRETGHAAENSDSDDDGVDTSSVLAYRPGGLPKRVSLLLVAAAALLLLAASLGGMLGTSAQAGGAALVAWGQGLATGLGLAPARPVRNDVLWGLPPGKVFVHDEGRKKLAQEGPKEFGGNGASIADGFVPLK